MTQIDKVLLGKLLDRVEPKASGCLEWTSNRNSTGYGQFHYKGKTHGAHRWMWIVYNGPIPKGLQVLHSCDNPPCCNLAHLSIGTGKQNMRQARERKRHFEAEKTHCDRGHLLAGADVWVAKNGSRHCKVCARARHRINVGWPVDLAYSAPKGVVGYVPPGLVRGNRPVKRKRGSAHCTKGHALKGDNRYETPLGQVECRTCRRVARERYARNYQARHALPGDAAGDASAKT